RILSFAVELSPLFGVVGNRNVLQELKVIGLDFECHFVPMLFRYDMCLCRSILQATAEFATRRECPANHMHLLQKSHQNSIQRDFYCILGQSPWCPALQIPEE